MAAHQISTKHTLTAGLAREFAIFAASGLSLVAAAIHLWAIPEHLAEWWGYGAFFVVAALLQGLFAVALLRHTSRYLLLAGIGLNLGVVSMYIVSRTAGIPLVGPHAGEVHAAGALDLTATIAELGLVAFLVALAGYLSPARNYAIAAGAQALGAGLALHLLYLGTHGSSGFVSHWLTGSLLWIPLSLLALLISTPLSRRFVAFFYGGGTGFRPRVAWALFGATAFAGASVAANPFAVSDAGAIRDSGLVLLGAFAVLLAVALLRGTTDEEPRKVNFWRPRAISAVAGLAIGLFVVAGPAVFGGGDSPARAQAAGQCNAASYDRSYDVAAIDVDIPFNRWGDVDPDGQVYVLQGDKEAVRNWSKPLAADPQSDPAGNRRLRPRPLVIRANAGECVKVDFTNELNDRQWGGRLLNPRASMQVRGMAYDAQTSDGGAVGYNADTTVPNTPGQNRISYFWKAPNEEGYHLFRSQTMNSGEEEDAGSVAHGLYGAVVVEPAGSRWTDPETGGPIYDGITDGTNNHTRVTKQSGDPYIDADIHPAGSKSFRETVQLAQDYNEVAPGEVGHGFNYGTEPARHRAPANPIGDGTTGEQQAPDSIGEETSLSSWVYGDPALVKLASGPGPWRPNPRNTENVEDCGLPTSCYVSNVTHSYKGDPTKIRYAMAGVAETHVFHLHAHEWLKNHKDTASFDPRNPSSATIDSRTFGPGEAFTADLLFGAGSRPGAVGDSIFHCHLYPHFVEGFWSLLRVHDVRENGTGKTPDGIKVRNLRPLPDRAAQAPPLPTANNPGYPRFIPGEFGWRAPQPPDSIREQKQDDPLTPVDESKDDPGTVAREDLKAATRIVAGETIDPTKLVVEKAVQTRNYGAATPERGAPLTDPCPTGAREVTYNVSMIQTDLVYNERGDHDTQGRIMVLNRDVEDVLAGRKAPEPLYMRVNAGDCVNINLTNQLPNWVGNDAFIKLAQTNMVGLHPHLVKFDVTASDGASNGWNYQQAAFSKEQMDFNREVLAGTRTCNWQGCRVPDPADYDPTMESGPVNVGQTITERWYADYELRTAFNHDHHFAALQQNRGLFGGLLVEPADMDFRNPKTGQYYQPINNASKGKVCGNSCEGTASGAAMDIIGPGAGDDFREFGLAFQDFVSLTRAGGDPKNRADVLVGPNTPEDYPDEDPGVIGINYKNAPFSERQEKGGRPVDPAYTFSSTVHGDPQTPVLQAYSEDAVQMRLLQGSHEHQHVFSMNGVRWREDPDDPRSPLTNAQTIGISEAFNFKVPKVTCGAEDKTCAGDYLYSSPNVDDLYMGMWGLFRARGKVVPSLLPLPDNANPNQPTSSGTPTATALQTTTSLTPPEANSPGTPCPTRTPVKKFNVVAMEKPLKYNKYGDNDPFGLIYALAEDEAAIKSGKKKPEPLVLRANQGDCIEVRLINRISSGWLRKHPTAGTDGDAMQPSEPITGTPAGLRVSLNPQLVKYDVRGSDGTAVGYNRDQTVAPGESKLYRWYADGELGTTNLTEFGDVRGHRHHGLFAGLNIEPRGSTYHDPRTGEQIKTGVSADIRVPGPNNDFREFTAFFQDGLNLRDKTGALIEEPPEPPHPGEPVVPAGEAHDHIDQGEKGFNYAGTPFHHRLGMEATAATELNPLEGQAMSDVYNSRVHGDPDTPIFRAYSGDDIRMRVLQGADKQRQNAFQLAGHSWRENPGDSGSSLISTEGGFSVGRTLNAHLPSAGNGYPGDYRYSDGMYRHHLSGGMWGIMRVYPKTSPIAALDPSPLRRVDNPLAAGNHPIMPLEISQRASSMTLSANPKAITFGKSTTLSGRLTAGGAAVKNQPVILEQRPVGASSFTRVGTAKNTDAGGKFSFVVKPRKNTDYRARFNGRAGAGLKPSSATLRVGVKVRVSNDTATTDVKVGRTRVISGAVFPAQTGSVKVTIKRGTKIVSTKVVRLKSSRYSLNYRPKGVGRYSVFATFAGDNSHLSGRSPAKSFRATR